MISFPGSPFWGSPLERSGCRQVGVGKVTSGFTPGSGCHGCLLITPGRGQREREVILVQNTQIRQSKQGLPIISGRPSKPITHQGSGCSGKLPWFAAGHTVLLPPFTPTCSWPLDIEGRVSGLERAQMGGCVRKRGRRPELEGPFGDKELRLGEDGCVPGHFIFVLVLGTRSLRVTGRQPAKVSGLAGNE